MIYRLGRNRLYKEFLILIPRNFNVNQFLIYAKTRPKSYLGNLLNRSYEFISKNTFSLMTEFQKFYSNEYKTFNKYLDSKYPMISEDNLNEITQYIEKGTHSLYKNINERLYDYTIQELFNYSDDYQKIIINLLKEEYR